MKTYWLGAFVLLWGTSASWAILDSEIDSTGWSQGILRYSDSARPEIDPDLLISGDMMKKEPTVLHEFEKVDSIGPVVKANTDEDATNVETDKMKKGEMTKLAALLGIETNGLEKIDGSFNFTSSLLKSDIKDVTKSVPDYNKQIFGSPPKMFDEGTFSLGIIQRAW